MLGDIEWQVSDGPVDYGEALAFMEQRAAAVFVPGRSANASGCSSIRHLFTAGTSADAAELFNPQRLPVFEAGRGGRYTYHGPGQRVGYLMLDLEKRGKDIRCFVHALEGWMIDTLADLGIVSAPRAGSYRHLGRRRRGREEDRRARSPCEAVGDASRLCAQCRSRSQSFRRHRALRDRRIMASPALPSSGNKCR